MYYTKMLFQILWLYLKSPTRDLAYPTRYSPNYIYATRFVFLPFLFFFQIFFFHLFVPGYNSAVRRSAATGQIQQTVCMDNAGGGLPQHLNLHHYYDCAKFCWSFFFSPSESSCPQSYANSNTFAVAIGCNRAETPCRPG